MRLLVDDPQFIYGLLDNAEHLAKSEKDSSEAWKSSSENPADRYKKSLVVGLGPVGLPFPLNHSTLQIRRFSDYYNASIYVLSRTKRAFDNLSKGLEVCFGEFGFDFTPTTLDGTGYLIKDGKTYVSIVDKGRKKLRELSVGDCGSYARRFGDDVEFCQDILELTKIGTVFINHCLSKSIKHEDFQKFENIQLSLNL